MFSLNPNISLKTELVDELALSVDFAQSYNFNIVLLGDYNLSYLNTEEKESLDRFLIPDNIEIVKKLTQTHSKTLTILSQTSTQTI